MLGVCGVVCCGLVWCGVVCCDKVWCGVIRCGGVGLMKGMHFLQ